MVRAEFLYVSVVYVTLLVGGFAAELSLTLLKDAVDEVRAIRSSIHVPTKYNESFLVGCCLFRWIATWILLQKRYYRRI